MKEEPLDGFSPVDTAFEFVAVKQEWVERGAKEVDWDEAQSSQNAAVDEDGVSAKTQPSDQHGSEAFEFVAVKQEWVEDDVGEADWNDIQGFDNAAVNEDGVPAETQPSKRHRPEEPELADTSLGAASFMQQSQDGTTTDKYDTAGARGGSNRYASRKECDGNKSNSLLPPGELVSSEKQDAVGSCEESCAAVSAALSDRYSEDTSETNCDRYPVDSERGRFSPSENGGVVGPKSHPPAVRGVYTCDVCQETFATKKAVRNHVQRHRVICDICNKSCRFVSDLEVHYRTHTGERPYHCETCGKAFSRRDNLRQHSLQHTGERPHRCDTCGKHFARSDYLRQHSRQHTGERPHACGVCHKRYPYVSGLKEHMLLHTGERPFNCDTCGRTFSSRGNLRAHKRTHTGERPYHCDICGKRFNFSSNLREHLQRHKRDRP